MKIFVNLLIALSLIPSQWAWSSEASFQLPNAQEIAAARAGEADFNASPWTNLKQAIEQHQEKAFFFSMDLFASLSAGGRNGFVGKFLRDILSIQLAPGWGDVFILESPEVFYLFLSWMKRRLLEPGNDPFWKKIPQPRFRVLPRIQYNKYGPYFDFLRIAPSSQVELIFRDKDQEKSTHDSGSETFIAIQTFFDKFLRESVKRKHTEENLPFGILVYSFLPKEKRLDHLQPLIREIQNQFAKPLLKHPLLLKNWPDTEIPEFKTWVEMLRDQTKNEADRAWAIQRLKELDCSVELSSEAPQPGEATQ